ncbi:MAG: hypothetical protein ACLGIS_10645, partial [Actinomycetes bacterium]
LSIALFVALPTLAVLLLSVLADRWLAEDAWPARAPAWARRQACEAAGTGTFGRSCPVTTGASQAQPRHGAPRARAVATKWAGTHTGKADGGPAPRGVPPSYVLLGWN